jgi:hypothetical protein
MTDSVNDVAGVVAVKEIKKKQGSYFVYSQQQ